MNHDYAHCIDFTDNCPKKCFRAQLVRDLNDHRDKYPPTYPVSWMSMKGTEPEAPTPKKRGRKVTNGKSVGRNEPVSQVEAEWAARKITDVPKLKALRAAGWTVKALADEFHCTETTVTETMEKEGIA